MIRSRARAHTHTHTQVWYRACVCIHLRRVPAFMYALVCRDVRCTRRAHARTRTYTYTHAYTLASRLHVHAIRDVVLAPGPRAHAYFTRRMSAHSDLHVSGCGDEVLDVYYYTAESAWEGAPRRIDVPALEFRLRALPECRVLRLTAGTLVAGDGVRLAACLNGVRHVSNLLVDTSTMRTDAVTRPLSASDMDFYDEATRAELQTEHAAADAQMRVDIRAGSATVEELCELVCACNELSTVALRIGDVCDNEPYSLHDPTAALRIMSAVSVSAHIKEVVLHVQPSVSVEHVQALLRESLRVPQLRLVWPVTRREEHATQHKYASSHAFVAALCGLEASAGDSAAGATGGRRYTRTALMLDGLPIGELHVQTIKDTLRHIPLHTLCMRNALLDGIALLVLCGAIDNMHTLRALELDCTHSDIDDARFRSVSLTLQNCAALERLVVACPPSGARILLREMRAHKSLTSICVRAENLGRVNGIEALCALLDGNRVLQHVRVVGMSTYPGRVSEESLRVQLGGLLGALLGALKLNSVLKSMDLGGFLCDAALRDISVLPTYSGILHQTLAQNSSLTWLNMDMHGEAYPLAKVLREMAANTTLVRVGALGLGSEHSRAIERLAALVKRGCASSAGATASTVARLCSGGDGAPPWLVQSVCRMLRPSGLARCIESYTCVQAELEWSAVPTNIASAKHQVWQDDE